MDGKKRKQKQKQKKKTSKAMLVVVVAVTVCELRGPIECARGEVVDGGGEGASARLLDRQFQFGWQQQQQQQAGRSVVNLARTDYNKPLSLARTRKTQNAHSANATTTKRFARLLLLLYYSYS